MARTGQRNTLFWKGDDREAKFDIFDLKGLIEEFLEQFGVRGVTYSRRSGQSELFLESAAIQLGGKLAEFFKMIFCISAVFASGRHPGETGCVIMCF